MSSNDPAFPSTAKHKVDHEYGKGGPGLSKRELFAIVALQGLLSFQGNQNSLAITSEAVKLADALMSVLERM